MMPIGKPSEYFLIIFPVVTCLLGFILPALLDLFEDWLNRR